MKFEEIIDTREPIVVRMRPSHEEGSFCGRQFSIT